MPRNSRGRLALVQGREVSMRKLRFSERQIAFISTKAAAGWPRGGTTCCPIVPEAPGLAIATPLFLLLLLVFDRALGIHDLGRGLDLGFLQRAGLFPVELEDPGMSPRL